MLLMLRNTETLMVKQQLRVLCFINYSHLPSSGGEGATRPVVDSKDIDGYICVLFEEDMLFLKRL